MAKEKKGIRAPWWIKLLLVLGIFAGVYIVAGYVVLPLVVRPIAEEKLSAALRREVRIDELGIDPVALAVTVKGVRLMNKDASAVTASFDSLYVDAQISSLLRKAVVIREVTVTGPYVNVIRRDDNTYNFSYLLAPDKDKKKKQQPSEPILFSVNNIRILGGSADFVDKPAGVTHTVRDLDVSVPFVSNFGYNEQIFVEPSFRAVINDTPFEMAGRTKPFSKTLETEFDIRFDNLDVSRYAAYAPVDLGFVVTSGSLDTDLKLDYIEYIGKKERDLKLLGGFVLKRLGVSDRSGGGLLELPELAVDITEINPFTREARFSSVKLTKPSLNVVRLEDGTINLMNALPVPGPKEESEPAKAPSTGAPVVEVNYFGIDDARIGFEDRSVSGPFKSVISPLDVTMVNFRNAPGWKTTVSVDAATDAGETIQLASGITAEPPGVEGTLSVTGVPVPRYAAYFPKELHAQVKGAVLGLSTRFDYRSKPGEERKYLSDTSVSLSGLIVHIDGDDRDVLKLGSLTVSGGEIDAIAKDARFGNITFEGGSVEVVRGADGKLNLARAYAAEDKGVPEEPKPEGPKKDEGKPWTVSVGEFALGGFEAGFRDAMTKEPFELRLKDIAAGAKNVSTSKDVTGEASLSFRVGKAGSVRLAGPVRVNPAYAKLDVDVSEIGIARYQPYVPEDAGVIVRDGYVNLKGGLTYADTGSGPKVDYAGMASVTRLATVDTIDLDDMLSWKSLYISGIRAGYAPVYANIDEVALTDFFAKLTITKDGRLNVRPQAKPEAEGETGEEAGVGQDAEPAPQPGPAVAEKKEKTPFKADIKRVTLQGGEVEFTDRSLDKTFNASLSEIGGHITGLTSKETGLADVDLKAKYNEFAPIDITGKINPLKDELFVDIKARFTDLDLSPATPYSNKYVGYPISKGKLSLNLEYHIENGKLDSKNVVFVDQLTFGDKVDSPTATSLPVKLAVALLRDRKGEIHLDLPVTGDLKDPQFSIWGLVVQVVVNLVSKAVTSPFSLLGAMFGGGDELGYLEYDYGQSVIDETGFDKLDKLAEALYQRPAVKMSISGHVDPERDYEAIRQARFLRSLKVEKFKETVGEEPETDEAVKAVDQMEILPEERDKYLLLAYEEADFPKPRNFIGMLKELPSEEMEKLMLTNIKVTEDDLRALALMRAVNVKDRLLETGKVGPERVFLVEPESLRPEEKEGVKESRAEFSLE